MLALEYLEYDFCWWLTCRKISKHWHWRILSNKFLIIFFIARMIMEDEEPTTVPLTTSSSTTDDMNPYTTAASIELPSSINCPVQESFAQRDLLLVVIPSAVVLLVVILIAVTSGVIICLCVTKNPHTERYLQCNLLYLCGNTSCLFFCIFNPAQHMNLSKWRFWTREQSKSTFYMSVKHSLCLFFRDW